MSDPWARSIARLQESAARAATVVAGLDGPDVDADVDAGQWRAPSGLPAWSRAHVAAHLALNAEGFVRALTTRESADPLPVYDSAAARDADIATLATASVGDVLARLAAADAALAGLLHDLAPQDRSGTIARTPAAGAFALAELPVTRRRELEVHVIDLDAGVGRASWPADFVAELLDRTTWDHHDDGPFTVHAVDLDRSWSVGEGGGATIAGPGAELAWWLTGRPGAALAGELPALSAWVRRPGP